MKNLLFFGMLVTAIMLVASCTEDEMEAIAQIGDGAKVTFTLGLEESTGTRAIAEGDNVDKLVYAVFDDENTAVIQKTEINFDGFPVDITMTLTKEQTYKVAFWAQDADCKAYTFDDEMNVTIDYGESITKNNDDSRDAFFAAKEFSVSGSTSIEITMKRPFAQINAVIKEDEWNEAVEAGLTVKQSSMTVESVGTSIDLFTGKVSGSTAATFSSSDIPTEDLMFNFDGDGVQESTYKWLSMSYILVNDGSDTGNTRSVLDNLVFSFTPEAGDNITVELTDMSVQRNYRTNLLLTDYETTIATVDGIVYYLENGEATIMVQDESLPGDIVIPETVTYNNASYTITAMEESAFANTQITSIDLPNGITTLGDYCFYGCSSLTSITLPDGIRSLGDYCFQYCSNLTSIDLPDSITSMGIYCFRDCSSLTSVDLPNGIIELKTDSFKNCTSLASIDLPDNITTLANSCFENCYSLASADMPANVISLEHECFRDCESLTSITLPASITEIEWSSFYGCSSLSEVICGWTDLDGVTTGSSVFGNINSECALYVPEGTKSIYAAKEPWSDFKYIYEYKL